MLLNCIFSKTKKEKIEKKETGKVFLAEDDALLREMYVAKFEKSGFEIESAEDGEQALEQLKKGTFDCVLLDVMMPKIDGFRVLQEIKKDSKLKKIPVAMLTNLGQEEDIKKGQEIGADDYIVKSNSTPAQIVEKISKLIK